MTLEKYANMKYKNGNRYFWCREYDVDSVGEIRKRLQSTYEEEVSYD